MHNLRNASCVLANFVLFLLPMSAFADAVDLVQVDVTDSEAQAAGLKVLRVYVQFDGPGDRLLTVESIDLTTDDPQGFFQHEFGLDLAPFTALCTVPGLELLCSDSYVTIGADTAVGNSTALDASWDSEAFNYDGAVVGEWFDAVPENENGDPTDCLQVLIGQFTVREKYCISGSLLVSYEGDGPTPMELSTECFSDACACPKGFFCTPCHHCVPPLCDDEDFCTYDFLFPSVGCVHEPVQCPQGQNCDPDDGECRFPCDADLNGDGVVGPFDLAVLLGAWGPNEGDPADLDEDGVVGPMDLAILLGSWGSCIECQEDEHCGPAEICINNLCISEEDDCQADWDCDDALFCNGIETCDMETSTCATGADPCADINCGEDEPICVEEDGGFCMCPKVPCFNFTLDQDNLVGTSGDDAFCAPLIFDPSKGTQNPSLQTGDSASGLAGADTLDATFNPAVATTVVATLSGIENFNLTNFGSFALTLPATSITDLVTVCSVGSVHDIFLTSLASNTGACLDGLADAADELNLSFLTGANTNPLTGTTDNLAVTIRNTSAGEVDVTTAANGFETVSIDSTGTSASTLTALIVSAGSSGLLNAEFSGSAELAVETLPNTLTAYDASEATGGLRLGSGSDVSTYHEFANPSSNFVRITGSSGDDEIIFADILTTTDFSTGTINLGEGTDVVQSTFAATFGAASKFRNTEEARFNASASGISHNFSGWTGLDMITIEEDGTANTFTLTSVPRNNSVLPTLNFRGDNSQAPQTFDTITYNAASASGSDDMLNITVGNRGTHLNTGSGTTNVHTIGGAALTVANIETINIDVADGPATFNGLTASTLVTLDVDAPTSNTGTNVTMGTITATGTTIQTVDASGVTGNFSATVDFAAATITISTGAGNDTITIGTSSAAAHNSTVTLGNGNNTFMGDTSTAGTDSVTTGSGNDTITAGPGVDTITTGAGQDTINMDNSDTNEAAIDTVTDFTAGTGGDIVKFDVTSLEALDTDGAGADDLIDYGAVTIAGTETFNINLVTVDGETLAAGDDMAVIDDDLATFAHMAAYIAATTATVDLVGAERFAAEDIVLLAYADGAGNTRIGICGDTGGGGADTDACDAGEDVLILSGVDVDSLVHGNFAFQP